MLLKMPSYCKNFRCIADKCTDNCCIGWEIDIDTSSAEYYKTVNGSFGEKLKNNITESPAPSFILCGERCPFLNKQNLCDIIINLGEDKLCQICRDHPRYFEWFSNIKEGGIDNLNVYNEDLTNLTFNDNSFDVVTILEVLEHIPNVKQAIKEATDDFECD